LSEPTTPAPKPAGSTPLTHREAAALAAKHGLRKLGARPAIGTYVRSLIRRRSFIWFLASSDAYGRNQGSYLGQLWAILNPLLNFAVMWFIFGGILQTDRGTGDFISYLAVGTFLFGFMSSALTQCSKVMTTRTQLIRALEFPRASLPMSVTFAELIMVWPATIVMLIILLIRGQIPHWTWLGLIPVFAMMYLFTLGVGFMLARICSITPDFANLVPIAMGLLRFVAGVMFSIPAMMPLWMPAALEWILINEPFHLFLLLARSCTIDGISATPADWALGLGWAVFFAVAGFLYFWRDEARYGRD
jgi:teichoic acid transport system permease protein